jgi:hypothetical protein
MKGAFNLMKRKSLCSLLIIAIVFSMSIWTVFADETSDVGDLSHDETTPEVTDTPPWLQVPPDDLGNLQLVDKQEILFTSEKFDFISVTTRNGHVFYILIRHDLPADVANVFFLSKVTERELLNLIFSTEQMEEYDHNNPSGNANRPSLGGGNTSNTPNNDSSDGTQTTSPPQETSTPQTARVMGVPVTNFIILGVLVVIVAIVMLIFALKKKRGSKPMHFDNSYADNEYDDSSYTTDDDDFEK